MPAAALRRLSVIFSLTIWLGVVATGSEAATAGTAGNTIIRNTITVNYSDAHSIAQTPLSATLDLSVNTVSATPTILVPASGSTDGAGSTWTYTVRVRTNSNGPRVISLAASDTASVNMTSFGASPDGLPAGVFLGSTTIDPSDNHGTIGTWGSGASFTFNVPNDGGAPSDSAESGGSANDGVVNGLKSGDIVYLYSGSDYYGPFSVGGVSESQPGNGVTVTPCSLELVNNLGAGALSNVPTAYAQIVEAKDVTMTVTQGSVTDATAPSSWSTTVTAAMAGAGAANVPVTTISHMGKIAITKYVRNVSTTAAGSSAPYTPPVTINGSSSNTYFTSGVSGRSGEILEYLAVITDSGTGDARSVVVTDALPGYATLLTGSAYGVSGGGDVFARAFFNGTEVELGTGNTGIDGVAYGGAAGTPLVMTFRLGIGCTPAEGGTLNSALPAPRPGSTAYLVYQVKVN